MQEEKIDTEFGTIYSKFYSALGDASQNGSDTCILFLHGNSVASRIFEPLKRELDNLKLNQRYSMIVFDFPGHGLSSNAPDPDRSYYQYAYAEAALKVLQHYKVRKAIVYGWSMGGHVALELESIIAASKESVDLEILGIMITGTPPVPKDKIAGFRKDSGVDISCLFNPGASEEDLKKVANVLAGTSPPPTWLIDDLLRTDRVAGRTMVVKFMEGKSSDQIKAIHDFRGKWVAVVNGANDPMLDLDYCDEVSKDAPRLWRGRCLRLENQLHAPFFDNPKEFAALFSEFVHDC